MKLIIKFVLLLVLLPTLYGVLVFLTPDIAAKIDTVLGMPGLSENIREGKLQYDKMITDIPSMSQIKSGAIDVTETITTGVQQTKQTIDTVRSGAEQVSDTYNQAKDTYESAKESYENIKTTLSGAQEDIQNLQDSLQGVQNITESLSQ